ncbi:uncharacterized protein IUM83_09861 [Phytophthora cinnamomi]|uniref:uncharacterized protein n=1 Tax=Phytophthora cinnamomi TaxID=4785 RepID=UPI003559F51A|nr:hypothetical protein IUM83_09861 [Phytophthora cinnamomi]
MTTQIHAEIHIRTYGELQIQVAGIRIRAREELQIHVVGAQIHVREELQIQPANHRRSIHWLPLRVSAPESDASPVGSAPSF